MKRLVSLSLHIWPDDNSSFFFMGTGNSSIVLSNTDQTDASKPGDSSDVKRRLRGRSVTQWFSGSDT